MRSVDAVPLLLRLGRPLPALFARRSAQIQMICAVKRKDLRKFLDGIYVSTKGNVVKD